MSDLADDSDQRIADVVTVGIARAQRNLGHSLLAFGACHWCESPVEGGRVFCSAECGADWARDRQRRQDCGL